MVFENGVKNTQAVAYNGARTVPELQIFIWGLDFNLGCTPWFLGCTYVAAASFISDFFFLFFYHIEDQRLKVSLFMSCWFVKINQHFKIMD